MREHPPTHSPEALEDRLYRVLLAGSAQTLAIEKRISEALAHADPGSSADMNALGELFAQARDAARREHEAYAAWKASFAGAAASEET